MISPIIKKLESRLSETQMQWAWFVALWCFGFCSVGIIAYGIRLIMGIE